MGKIRAALVQLSTHVSTPYLVFGGNKPLPCLYQHEPQQGPTPNGLTKISRIVGASLLLPPFRVGVYLSFTRVYPDWRKSLCCRRIRRPLCLSALQASSCCSIFTRTRQIASLFYLQNQSKLADVNGGHRRRRNKSLQNPKEAAEISSLIN